MKLLACDIGTTHCKAGLFELDGTVCRIAARATPVCYAADGSATLDPEQLWQVTAAVLAETAAAARGDAIAAVGVASMAESGLLVDRRTGRPCTALIPWFDPAAAVQAELIGRLEDPVATFRRSGLRVSYKCGLAKLLWLRQQASGVTDGAVWLSAADFVAHRLTGQLATDPTLAARTLAYRIAPGGWDAAWLARFGLNTALFPPVLTSGQIMGRLAAATAAQAGLPADIPVAICGHDHVVAALTVGATAGGTVLDSIGTAEALVGALPARPLTDEDYASGLVFGPHVMPGRVFWMGALSAAGRSLDWLRGVLGDPPLTYEALAALSESVAPGPTDLLFLPYLLGAQAPWPDPHARGAFIGLTASQTRSDLVKAILQGVAYEIACILRAAEMTTGQPISELVVTGGGARVPGWAQMRADVMGKRVVASPHPEATLLGAALLAAAGAGLYPGASMAERLLSAQAAIKQAPPAAYQPDSNRQRGHARLLAIYRTLQAPLRAAAADLAQP